MQVDAHNDLQAQHRFESFKLGQPRPAHAHARSHSRNTSMSSFSFGASKSAPAIAAEAPPPSAKRNSHHRRRSSVSTRRESAEMMGKAVPELPASISDDNINLGDKDSVRRRALWALEGKPDASYSRVEIPELTTPDSETKTFDFPSKPSFPAGSGANLASLMSNKRDSFKLRPSSSSKDQLHTLVEEDEEEEDSTVISASPLAMHPPAIPAVKPLTARPRPATLSLRPLSLTADNMTTNAFGLPTPPSTSQAHPRSGLRSLSLCSDRDSASPSPPMSLPSRKPTLNLEIAADGSLLKRSSTDSVDIKASRRSSIAYKRSSSGAGLPTPEMTPTFDSRRSISSVATDDDDSSVSSGSSFQSRPLSTSEQHFLFKSHNALLTRIMDLERNLSSRRRDEGYNSRPSSVLSDVSTMSSPAEDEMLRLVADLKGERDELKRDVEGWRERVSDMDKQLVTFAKRVENERREAWVARTKCGMVEVERSGLAKAVDGLNSQVLSLQGENRALQSQIECLTRDKSALEDEVSRLKAAQDVPTTPRPWETFGRTRGVGFGSSQDSASTSSVTDVDIDESPMEFGFSLKSVAEEPEDTDDSYFSDEDNGLAGYEDEDEDDLDITNDAMSDDDFGSDDDFPRSVVSLKDIAPQQEMVTGLATPAKTPPSHQSRASLSKTWTFPRGPHNPRITTSDSSSEVDRFFGCLDDKEDSPVLADDGEDLYSFERSKGLFASGFKYESDTNMPAWLLGGSEDEEDKGLDVVIEADEEEEEGSEATKVDDDDDDVFSGVLGGIKITFTPPADDTVQFATPISSDSPVEHSVPDSPSPKARCEPLPGFDVEEDDDEESSTPFNFGRPFVTQTATPPASASRSSTSPSSIPRAVSRPSVLDSPTPHGFSTPPNRRSVIAPSFIPQPVAPKPKASTTFIRQPARKPMGASQPNASFQGTAPNGSTHTPQINKDRKMNAFGRFSDDLSMGAARTGGSSVMQSVDLGRPASESPKPASSWSPRLFSSFTNYIGLSLSPKMEDESVMSPPVREKRFVSKEQQLEKLKARLEREGAAIIPFAGDVCKNCHDDDSVFL